MKGPVKEDENSVKAELKDGVLTITFEKEKVEAPTRIQVQQPKTTTYLYT